MEVLHGEDPFHALRNAFMPDKPPKKQFALIVEDAQPKGDVPIWNRLRSFLKCALRSYGIRCVRVEEILPPEDPPCSPR